MQLRAQSESLVKPHYTCPTHKDYKEYQVCHEYSTVQYR